MFFIFVSVRLCAFGNCTNIYEHVYRTSLKDNLKHLKLSSHVGQLPTLYLTIQTRGNVSSVNNQLVRCELIGSLVTTLREFKALCSLRNNRMMACPVLKPHVSFFASCKDGLPTIDMLVSR